ncbi:hypothetical protein Poli38472_009114 [Pythium oligandrum]|uniref:Protein-serine/threonine kinase n=1 Tax=Pythium oligandrum TaxID=41045 RepID=A0A8K1CMA0_PYTOL|nr:hypothetical protein Poli38472_009114 [Pythium oligandrum]|eukprot:TMW64947.1 hypothetical protein Poli38472_009114 [Pythium oligandrum]
MVKFPPRVLAEVYRQHHIPLPPITLQALLQRGPRATPAVVEKLQAIPSALQKWKEENEAVIVKSAQLLHREVPIRLARRIVDLENLPDGLPDAPSILTLREGLIESFDQMISFPLPTNLETEQEFMEMHRRIRAEHATMHGNLADALEDLKTEPDGLSSLLDNFYNSRIGIRMLVDQHLAAQNPHHGYSGIIADHCSPMTIAQSVIDKVTPLWQERLGDERALPEFDLVGNAEATYRYIPQHIETILSEVIKAAVLNSLNAKTLTPPPVQILVAGGAHGVCIKVSDQGGGMTRAQANALLSYVPPSSSFSSSSSSASAYDPVAAALERRASDMNFQTSFGLRIASLYAAYFGGALALMPMEGHGVDSYIYMNCLTEASQLR